MIAPIPTDERIVEILTEGNWQETPDGWVKDRFHMAPQTMLNAAKWEAFFLENGQ